MGASWDAMVKRADPMHFLGWSVVVVVMVIPFLA